MEKHHVCKNIKKHHLTKFFKIILRKIKNIKNFIKNLKNHQISSKIIKKHQFSSSRLGVQRAAKK